MERILFVIPEFSHGGTNKSLENLLSLLDKDEYDIHIYSLYEDGGDYYKEAFKQYIIKKSRLYYWLHDNAVTRKIMGLYNKITHRNNFSWLYKREVDIIQNKHNYDTIIAFQEGTATQFVSYANNIKKKIAWIHCDYKDWATMSQRKRDIVIYYSFTKVACVSETTKKSFCEVFPEYANKCITVYNTLDTENIKKLSLRNISLPFPENNYFNILSVGRLSKVKQFDKIPSIVKGMEKDIIKRIKWYIIGDGIEKERIRKEIIKHDLEDVIILLGPKDNPYPYYRISNLHVCTSESESFSYTIFESKILHIPVVSNNFPVAYEVLNNECGWVCPIDRMHFLLTDMINDKRSIYSKVSKSIKNYEYDNKSIIKQIQELL